MILRLFPNSDARLCRPYLKSFLSLCHTISIAGQSIFSGDFFVIQRSCFGNVALFSLPLMLRTSHSPAKLLLYSDDLHAIKQEVDRERLQLARSRLGYNESRSNEEFPQGSLK